MRGKNHKDQARFLSILGEDVGLQAYELVMNGYRTADRKLIARDHSHDDLKLQAETPCTCGIHLSSRAKHNKR